MYTALAGVQGLEAAAYQSVQRAQRVSRQVEDLQRRQLSQRSDIGRLLYNIPAQIQFSQTFQRAYVVGQRGYLVPGQIQNFQLGQSVDPVTGDARHRVPRQIQPRCLGTIINYCFLFCKATNFSFSFFFSISRAILEISFSFLFLFFFSRE